MELVTNILLKVMHMIVRVGGGSGNDLLINETNKMIKNETKVISKGEGGWVDGGRNLTQGETFKMN